MSQFKRPESVLVVIYDRQFRVLVLQRMDDPLFWQSVTGSLEEGESPLTTAIREVQEETGIDVAKLHLKVQDCQQVNHYTIRPQWRHRYPPGVIENKEHVFALQVDVEQTIELTEHHQYQWLSAEQAIKKVWSDTNRKAIEDVVLKQRALFTQ